MSEHLSSAPDEELADVLRAYEEALAEGMTPAAARAALRRDHPSWGSHLDHLSTFLDLLDQAWPPHLSPLRTEERSEPFPLAPEVGEKGAVFPLAPEAGDRGEGGRARRDADATPPSRPPGGDPDLPAVPGYEVLGVLGGGGMGVVYKARQRRLRRLVALKRLRGGQGQLVRLRREADALARLQHPHIVQIYEVVESAGEPYLVLEYVPGGSLAQRLTGAPQPPLLAAILVETLARAIHAAHQQGIIHRDLKPGNILLTGVRGQGAAKKGKVLL